MIEPPDFGAVLIGLAATTITKYRLRKQRDESDNDLQRGIPRWTFCKRDTIRRRKEAPRGGDSAKKRVQRSTICRFDSQITHVL
jgi:hypothetical protein